MGSYSGLLYARPSFLTGMARAFDIGGTLNVYNESTSGAIADRVALASDGQAIGEDLRRVIADYARDRELPPPGYRYHL